MRKFLTALLLGLLIFWTIVPASYLPTQLQTTAILRPQTTEASFFGDLGNKLVDAGTKLVSKTVSKAAPALIGAGMGAMGLGSMTGVATQLFQGGLSGLVSGGLGGITGGILSKFGLSAASPLVQGFMNGDNWGTLAGKALNFAGLSANPSRLITDLLGGGIDTVVRGVANGGSVSSLFNEILGSATQGSGVGPISSMLSRFGLSMPTSGSISAVSHELCAASRFGVMGLCDTQSPFGNDPLGMNIAPGSGSTTQLPASQQPGTGVSLQTVAQPQGRCDSGKHEVPTEYGDYTCELNNPSSATDQQTPGNQTPQNGQVPASQLPGQNTPATQQQPGAAASQAQEAQCEAAVPGPISGCPAGCKAVMKEGVIDRLFSWNSMRCIADSQSPTASSAAHDTPPLPPCAHWSAEGVCEEVATALDPAGDSVMGYRLGNGVPTDPSGFVKRILTTILGIAGGIALLLIIIAGYKIMMSRGKPEVIQQAREQLIAAIVGLLFIIFSFTIFQLVVIDLLHIPGICADANDPKCAAPKHDTPAAQSPATQSNPQPQNQKPVVDLNAGFPPEPSGMNCNLGTGQQVRICKNQDDTREQICTKGNGGASDIKCYYKQKDEYGIWNNEPAADNLPTNNPPPACTGSWAERLNPFDNC